MKSGELIGYDPAYLCTTHKFTTRKKESDAETYAFWVDWFSMPQPGAERVENIGEKNGKLRAEGSNALIDSRTWRDLISSDSCSLVVSQ